MVEDAERRLADLLRTLAIRHEVRRAPDPTVPLLCWHCCHEFEGPRLQFPVTYDDRTDRFRVTGSFCSWECVKGYGRDTFSPRVSSIKSANIRHYYRKVSGSESGFKGIRSAPPRVALRAFGGSLTIEEFRACRDAGLSYELDVTRLVPVLPAAPAPVFEPQIRHEAAKPVDFADATCTSDNLRLKRPKPLGHAGRNTLERVLGLNSLLKKK